MRGTRTFRDGLDKQRDSDEGSSKGSRSRLRHMAALLALVMAAGCDGILGIDGLVVGCVEGDRQCSPQDPRMPQSCGATGRWINVEQPCATGQVCGAGACVPECTPGEPPRCNGKEAQICNASGAWETLETCGYECKDGGCKCEPKTEQCINNRPQVCAENGSWQDKPETCIDRTCIVESALAKCSGECAPGKRCLGTTPQVCSNIGKWEDATPCDIAQVCIDGICGCLLGDQRCFENKRQTCNAMGQWEDDETCVESTCNPATLQCEGECVAGEKQCNQDEKTPRRCNSKGFWQDDPACVIACANGICTACSPGEVDCEGNTPRTCGMDGQWQTSAPCDGQTCIMGACQGECAPGKRCLGNTPQTCDETGQWEGSTPCAAGQSCSGGSCDCIEGDRRCFDNTPQLCNALNQWEDLAPRCMDQTCDAESGGCIGVCEAGRPRCQDADTAQTCTAQGVWDAGVTCGTLGCVGVQCAVCQPGLLGCSGNTPQTCGMNGQWQDEAECAAQTCLGGTCQGQCANGDIRCAGNWPQVCDASGVWQASGQPCAQGESCYQGQCAALCTPGTKRCAGDYPQFCDDDGHWQSNGTPCGKCIACNPDTGMCEAEPMPLATCNEPTAIATGGYHTCALFPNGKIKCWGYNLFGQLGLGDDEDRGDLPGEMGANLPFVDLGLDPGVTVAEISTGGAHTCARTSDGRIKCWGANNYGQLGLGDKDHRGDQLDEMQDLLFVDIGLPAGVTVAEVSAGGYHTCARTSDGRVKCWGDNTYGQLGIGDTNHRGDQLDEMGQDLPFVDLGLGVTVAEISAGDLHTCARTSDGQVKCWGRNGGGQLGLGDTNDRGDQVGEMGGNVLPVDLGLPAGITVTDVSAAFGHTCALLLDGQVKCWGGNVGGTLGLGDADNRGDESIEMGGNLLPVDLGLPTGVTVTDVGSSGTHRCARTSVGAIKCWGFNALGQLGLGDATDRGAGPGEMGADLPFADLGLDVTVTTIRSGWLHTCALLEGGSVKCWGSNANGQLGLSDIFNRGDEPNEMGDNLPIVDL